MANNLDKKAESPIAQKWLWLPSLQSGLRVKTILALIGNAISTFVEADPETVNTMKPAHPRICVEFDMTKQRPTNVFLKIGEAEGFWQPIAFEGNSTYCTHCKMYGHATASCRRRPLADSRKAVYNASQIQAHNKDQPSTSQVQPTTALRKPNRAKHIQQEWQPVQPANRYGILTDPLLDTDDVVEVARDNATTSIAQTVHMNFDDLPKIDAVLQPAQTRHHVTAL